MPNCSWCDRYTENSLEEYEETFCSLKCLHEYTQNGYKMTEKSGCFIATAVYGSYDHDIVFDLRLFRDNWLSSREWGIRFISFYYKHSPRLAQVIKSNSILRWIACLTLIKPLHFIVTSFKLHSKKN